MTFLVEGKRFPELTIKNNPVAKDWTLLYDSTTGITKRTSIQKIIDLVNTNILDLDFTEDDVRNTDLFGFDDSDDSVIIETDTVITAFGKLQGQINALPPPAWGSISGTLSAQTDLVVALTTAENNAKAYADTLVVGLLDDRGNFDASGDVFPSTGGSGSAGAILKGDLWTISVGGTLGGHVVTAGDVIRALTNTPGQTDTNWAISENNFGYVAENLANKNASGGYAGLSGYSIQLKNSGGTVTSTITSLATSTRTYTFKDEDGTVAFLSDLGTSTGDLGEVISVLNTPPGGETLGDAYLVGTSPTGAFIGHAGKKAVWNGASYDFTPPALGNTIYVIDEVDTKRYNGSIWVSYPGTTVLHNGNLLGVALTVGTKDSFGYQFKTANVTRGKFTAAGNFNVYNNSVFGSSSVVPTARVELIGGGSDILRINSSLSVKGIYVSSTSNVSIGSDATSGYKLDVLGSTFMKSTGSDILDLQKSNGHFLMAFRDADTVDFFAGGSVTSTIRSGYFGVNIGNTSPLAPLHVKGGSAGNTALFYNSSSTLNVVIQDDGKVGLGVTSPTVQFDVVATTVGTGAGITKFRPTSGVSNALYNDYGQFIITSDTGENQLQVTNTGAGSVSGVSITGKDLSQIMFGSTVYGEIARFYGNNDGMNMRHRGYFRLKSDATNFTYMNTDITTGNVLFTSLTATPSTPTAKVHILDSDAGGGTTYSFKSIKTGSNTTNIAGYFEASGATNNFAIVGLGSDATHNNYTLYLQSSANDPVLYAKNDGWVGVAAASRLFSSSKFTTTGWAEISRNDATTNALIIGSGSYGGSTGSYMFNRTAGNTNTAQIFFEETNGRMAFGGYPFCAAAGMNAKYEFALNLVGATSGQKFYIYDGTINTAGAGGKVNFASAVTNADNTQTELGSIGVLKENGTSGNTKSYMPFIVNDGSTLIEAGRFSSLLALELAGTIKTVQPSGNGAGVWKLGKVITATVALDTTKYVEVDIDGAIVKVGIVT